ncbi:MAG: lipopolysaccharide heptosyltransferase II [Deltaproteobacteria bacterium]
MSAAGMRAVQEKIIVVEVNWLGDILFSTPALRALRRDHPRAYIAVLVVPRGKQVLSGNPYIDELIIFDEEKRHRGWRGKWRLVRDLKIRRFTLAYILRPSVSRTLLLWLAGVKRRIGFDRKAPFLLTEAVAPPQDARMHRGDVYYYLVERQKIPAGERFCDFYVAPADRVYIDDFLRLRGCGRGRSFAALHVGGNWEPKRWPKDSFAELVRRLREEYDVQAVISGSVLDDPLAREIADALATKPVIACGQTTLRQLGALFERAAVVVSADSGPLHVAAAVKARVIGLFGPTDPVVTGPLGLGDLAILRPAEMSCAVPCYERACPDNRCMKAITVDQVLEEAEKRQWIERLRA